MVAPVVSNARLAVLLASLAAGGAVMHTANTPLLNVILITVALLAVALGWSNSFIQQAPVKTLLCCALLSVIPLAFYAYADCRMVKPAETDLIQYQRTKVVFTARVSRADLLSAPRELTLSAVSLESPRAAILTGKTQLYLRDCPAQTLKKIQADAISSTGEELLIRVRGRIVEPKSANKAWEFDKKKFLARAGVFSTCYLSKYADGGLSIVETVSNKVAPEAYHDTKSMTRLASWYESQMVLGREIIVQTHRRFLPPKLADLLSSMVLGNRAIQLPKEITNEFRDVGLSHILAASGFNLTIVIAMTFALCRWLIPSAVLTNLLCFVMMLTFVSLAGVSPSVLRAALMCSIMLWARCGQRRMMISSTLACSFLLTVSFDPLCTDDLGLQLSYAATVGLVLGATSLSEAIYFGDQKWKKLLGEAFAVVLVAQLSVLPIQLYFFWKTGTLFMPANLLITPLVTPLTMLGFATSTAALFNTSVNATHIVLDPLIGFADAIAFIPLALMMLIVKAFCAVENANIAVGQPSPLALIFYYFCLIAWFISLRMKRKRVWTTILFVIATASLFWHAVHPKYCIALIHNHIIIVDEKQNAFEVGNKISNDKMMEKFITFHGSKLSSKPVKPLYWKRNIQYIQVSGGLFILNTRDPEANKFAQAYDATEIKSLANSKQARDVILLTSKADAMADVFSDQNFEKCSDQSRVESYGFRGMQAVLYIRRSNEITSDEITSARTH